MTRGLHQWTSAQATFPSPSQYQTLVQRTHMTVPALTQAELLSSWVSRPRSFIILALKEASRSKAIGSTLLSDMNLSLAWTKAMTPETGGDVIKAWWIKLSVLVISSQETWTQSASVQHPISTITSIHKLLSSLTRTLLKSAGSFLFWRILVSVKSS